jgi:hypothetical protein
LSLWPFPADALRSAALPARRVAVLEMNAGQMIDDAPALLGAKPVVAIGGSRPMRRASGRSLLDSENVRERVESALAGREVSA